MKREFKGLEILDEQEKEIVNRLFDEYYSKVQRKMKKDTSMKIYIQKHEAGGQRKKYSIDISVTSSAKIFKANAFDWDLARTIHKVLNKIESEAEHKLRVSEQK